MLVEAPEKYSVARSVVKGIGTTLQTGAALAFTTAVALAEDPVLVARMAAIAAGHKWAVATLAGFVFAGRVLIDWRKHRNLGR